MRRDLLLELYKYGMHLGSNHSYNTNLNYFVIGTRFNYAIIDINKSFYTIKKVLLFLKTLSSNQGTICFYHTLFSSMNLIYKTCLLNIVLKSFQSMIVHPWLYGSVNNYFFSFFFFIKDIIHLWTKENTFTESSKDDSLDLFDEEFSSLKKVLPMNFKLNSLKHKYTYELASNWSHSQPDKASLQGKNSVHFIKQVCNNTLHTMLKQQKMFKFKHFFLRFFFFIHEKKKDYLFLNKQLDINDYLSKINKRVLFYWRLLLYYKYFQSFFELPDCFFIVFPDGNDTPLKEVSRSNEIISIGLVDTNSNINNIHYPIVVNDDSMIIIFFFFTLFSNLFLKSKMSTYTNLFK